MTDRPGGFQYICEECGYELAGLDRCPECGRAVSKLWPAFAQARRRVIDRWWVTIGGHLAWVIAAVVLSEFWIRVHFAGPMWREHVVLACVIEGLLAATTVVALAYPRFLRASIALRLLKANLLSVIVWAAIPASCLVAYGVRTVTGLWWLLPLCALAPVAPLAGVWLTIISMSQGIEHLTLLGPRLVGLFVVLTLAANLGIALHGLMLVMAMLGGV